mgnify:CR=1 FL=1
MNYISKAKAVNYRDYVDLVYMNGTTALHMLGDISRDEGDLFTASGVILRQHNCT